MLINEGTHHYIGFLEDKAPLFMKELWALLLSAQESPTGIPLELIREKLDERNRKKEELEIAKGRLDKIKRLVDPNAFNEVEDKKKGTLPNSS